MKKRILILTFCSCCFLNIAAQTERGQFALSGRTDAGLLFGNTSLVSDSLSGKSQKNRAFNANMGFAWFIVKNVALNITGSFHYQGTESDYASHYTHQYTAGVIPGITYFVPLKGNLKPTLSVGAGYVWYFSGDKDTEGLSLNVAPGISYFANKNISLDLGLQYAYNQLTNKNSGDGYKYQQQAWGLLFGLSYYF